MLCYDNSLRRQSTYRLVYASTPRGNLAHIYFVNEDLNNNAFLDGDEDAATAYNIGNPNLPDYFNGYGLR